MVFTTCASSELQFGACQEVIVRERQEALSRKAWEGAAVRASIQMHALSGG